MSAAQREALDDLVRLALRSAMTGELTDQEQTLSAALDKLDAALAVIAERDAEKWDEGWDARDQAGMRRMGIPASERGNPYRALAEKGRL